MPKVTLELEVTQTGVDVRQVFGQVDGEMKKLKAGSEGAAKGLERTDASVRELARGAKLFGAVLLADVNPALAQSIMNFRSLAQASRLAGTAITGGLVVAAAAGVAAIVAYTRQTNEAIEFQVKLDESVRRFDVSGMTSQLKALGLELEIEEKKARAFLGGLKILGGFEGFQGFDPDEVSTLGEVLAEGRLQKLRERQEQLRKEIERITPMFFEQEIINLSNKLRAAQSERTLLTGTPATRGAESVDRLQREERDAKRIIELQTEIAKGQAASEEERARISVIGSYRRLIVEEETKTKILTAQRTQAAEEKEIHDKLTQAKREALDKYADALRGQLSKATAEYEKHAAEVKRIDADMRQAKMTTQDMLAEIRQAGMSPAEAFADRERRAQEKLAATMRLSGQEQIDALKAIQREYLALALIATQAEEAQKATASVDPWASQRAAQYWWMPENKQAKPKVDPKALAKEIEEIGKKLEEAYARAKQGAQDSFERAKALADESQRHLEVVGAATRSVLALRDAYLAAADAAASIPAPPSPGGGGGGGARTGGSATDFVPGVTGGVWYVDGDFQHGGFVPGPRRAPILAEPGEYVLNQDQQRAIRDLGLRGGGITLHMTVNGSQEDPAILARRIAEQVGRELERLGRRGYGPNFAIQ